MVAGGYWRDRRQARLATGLCLLCDRSRVNATFCEVHRDRYRERARVYSREWRKGRQRQGICVECSRPVVTASHCEFHAELRREECKSRRREFRRNHPVVVIDRPRRKRGGTGGCPQENRSCKLQESDISVILGRRESGESYRAIGRDYGVSHEAIRLIVMGKTWKHVPRPIEGGI